MYVCVYLCVGFNLVSVFVYIILCGGKCVRVSVCEGEGEFCDGEAMCNILCVFHFVYALLSVYQHVSVCVYACVKGFCLNSVVWVISFCLLKTCRGIE